MKNLLVSLSFAILTLFACASCKKSTDVDPRDQYIGKYAVSVSTITGQTNSSAPTTISDGNDVLIVTKGVADKDLTFSFTKNSFSIVNLSGNSFDFNKSEKAYTNSGVEFWPTYTGNGAFSGNDISMNITIDATVLGATVRQVATVKGKKM